MGEETCALSLVFRGPPKNEEYTEKKNTKENTNINNYNLENTKGKYNLENTKGKYNLENTNNYNNFVEILFFFYKLMITNGFKNALLEKIFRSSHLRYHL